MKTALVFVGDMHVNSTVGLCPGPVELDDGGLYYPSKSQEWLWEEWLKFANVVKKLKAKRTYLVINGDWCDVNSHSSFQLITDNKATVIQMMLKAIKPLSKLSDAVYVIRGTETHTGGAGHLEELAGRAIGAERDPNNPDNRSLWVLEGTFEGVNILATHHPGTNSMRPWTLGGGANRAAAMVMNYYYNSDWRPDIAVFNHVHHNEDSYDNHPVRAVFNRCWTLKNAYDFRIGFGIKQEALGGLVILVDNGEYEIIKHKVVTPKRKIITE